MRLVDQVVNNNSVRVVAAQAAPVPATAVKTNATSVFADLNGTRP